MSLTLEQAIARVPLFANARELKTTPLAGGITNKNFRVEADGAAYVLRIPGQDTALLGIRRAVEFVASRAAGELGVAPPVVCFIEPEGCLVTRFIDGAHIAPAAMSQPHNLRRVAEKLRTFHHHAPLLASEFNVFRRIEMLTGTARQHNGRLPNNFDWIVERVREVERALMRAPYTPRPCHDDLLNLNFLDARGELYILDWEYAGMGDVFFDLANFSSHHRLDDDQVRALLRAYWNEATPQHFARLKLMWALSEIHEALWGTAQTGISKLDEDFQGYADLWFGRATQALQDARWNEWLEK